MKMKITAFIYNDKNSRFITWTYAEELRFGSVSTCNNLGFSLWSVIETIKLTISWRSDASRYSIVYLWTIRTSIEGRGLYHPLHHLVQGSLTPDNLGGPGEGVSGLQLLVWPRVWSRGRVRVCARVGECLLAWGEHVGQLPHPVTGLLESCTEVTLWVRVWHTKM